MADLIAAVSGYARRFHDAVGEEHHVASPLGAWLVLALAASSATGTDREELEEILGCDAESAVAFAAELLRAAHPALRLATAAWRRTEVETPALTAWLERIAVAAQVDSMPDEQGADAWAADATGGLIERFPVEIDARTVVILASALATSISWQAPFTIVAADQLHLPLAPGFEGLRQLLRDPGAADTQAIVDSPFGPLGVHAAPSADNDLVVVSVIARADIPAREVLAAAHPIATSIALRSAPSNVLSLFDLPLGGGHAWTLTERPVRTTARDGREERFETVLPAWSAESKHELLAHPDLGFRTAARSLMQLLPPDPRKYEVEAKQVALARYTRTGFEAAAVTAVAVRLAAAISSREGVQRTARLEFGRPFAVVAVARGQRSPWAGLPVFSAWVAAPDDAS